VRIHLVLVIGLLSQALDAAQQALAPTELPPAGTTQLTTSLAAAAPHAHHLWRDTPPFNDDGTVNAYVEIERGDRRKWEFDMRAGVRAIDRVMPEAVGGYPVNYGFVPQTVSYDGDPFDVLVLGPPIAGGRTVRGVIVGLMLMEDEKGMDSKVVVSRPGRDGNPLHALSSSEQERIGRTSRGTNNTKPASIQRFPGGDPSRKDAPTSRRRTRSSFTAANGLASRVGSRRSPRRADRRDLSAGPAPILGDGRRSNRDR